MPLRLHIVCARVVHVQEAHQQYAPRRIVMVVDSTALLNERHMLDSDADNK